MTITKIWNRLSSVTWLASNCRRGRNIGTTPRASWLRCLISRNILKLRHQVRGGGFLVTDIEGAYHSILKDAGRTPERTIDCYVRELLEWRELSEYWERRTRETMTPDRVRVLALNDSTSYWEQVIKRRMPMVLFYALTREFKPKVIVETGTSYGGATSFYLAAAFKNGYGRVVSIDIPPIAGKLTMDETVDESEIGSFIPEFLKSYWDLRLGDAKVLLPKVLAEMDVELFIHDSLHTRTHMSFEYAVARALMQHRSLIITDDTLANNAFDSFLATHQLTGYAIADYPNSGITVNLFDDEELSIGTEIVNID